MRQKRKFTSQVANVEKMRENTYVAGNRVIFPVAQCRSLDWAGAGISSVEDTVEVTTSTNMSVGERIYS